MYLRNLDAGILATLANLGLVGVADVRFVTKEGAAPDTYWDQIQRGVNLHVSPSSGNSTAINDAINACTGGRNDVVMISPDQHTVAASIALNENMTHIVGMYPGGLVKQRARIGHGSNLVNKLINITGYGCTLAHLHTMYGNNDDTDVDKIAWQITGNRISVRNCHIGGPYGANEADQADFNLINFAETSGGDGLEHYFKNCVIGDETTAWTNGDMMKMSGTPRMVFEDCTFLLRADNAQVTILDGTAGDGQGFVLFKNCVGINLGSALDVAFGGTGIAAGTDIILHNTGFTGVTDLIAAANEAKVITTAIAVTADVTIAGLGQAFDHTA